MEQPRIQLLRSMPIFAGIHVPTLRFLLQQGTTVEIPVSGFFFQEGDPGNTMYVLETGEVAVLKRWEGRDVLLNTLTAGDCFGEMAMIDFCPRSASVVATRPCTALEFSHEQLHRLYDTDLEQLTRIYMNMGREVSRKLRRADSVLFRQKMEAKLVDGSYVFYAI